MQKICFKELVRRGGLPGLSSGALKVYILDEKGLYGKSIQCRAMEELAVRTGRSSRQLLEEETVNAAGELNG